ncbi:YaaC family protein [Nonomuraea solani]|nr:YaaC family protein [Nonomuraea solani]
MADNIDLIWQQLRATRWDPPAAAGTNRDRRRTYVMALEQAEQLMRAAGGVGPAASPLLLFYGLSQAGRAVASAAVALTGTDWRLEGHGIRVFPGSALAAANLADVTTVTDEPTGRGSFARLSELLGSPLWPRSGEGLVRFEVLWDCLPESRDLPLRGGSRDRRIVLNVEHRSISAEPTPIVDTAVWPLPAWVMDAEDGHVSLAEYLSSFVLGARAPIPYVLASDGGSPRFDRHVDEWGEVTMNWQLPDGSPWGKAEKIALLQSFTRQYVGGRLLFPTVTSERKSVHPLMAWWAVLFVLSMLARYEPARWNAHIDVDSSPHAVYLERILAQAREVIPHLVAETLQEVR